MADALPSVWIQDLTWEEVSSYLEDERIVIVPIGSTEQHGPAGVLGVDSYVAITLAEDVAERKGVLVAPPIWYGDSSHHGAFPGTITVRPDTLTLLIRDVARSLARHGFTRIILLNGHKGSNLPALNSAVRVLHDEELPEVLFAVADPLHLARSASPTIKETNEHHAGELELSHVHYRYPGKIRTDRLTDASVDFDKVFGGFVGNDLFGPAPDGVEIIWSGDEQRAFTPTGSFSSSKGLSEDKGKRYHDHIVGRLGELIDWLRTYDGPIGHRTEG
ncbi:creatininase family protein [Amycolatopsis rhabdoformis]|uniref:Creatininase family protein n=1 Tax=Amycolatopsis rhabdoformis TaxID=1448059 RepID=A0ABZ1IBZ4_9PSEU|nr:creatininase family protein [Amycolatopsis rhabdoformis]WSE31536.1 creatininase family protein [Amycolatopsis rhabdoformis]